MVEPVSLWIDYRENKIHALRFGQGKRLLIVFHGFADRASLFLKLRPALEPYYDVVAIDLPYHGNSDWQRPMFKPRHTHAFIQHILQLTGYESCSLMGHSMGGFVVLRTYEYMPTQVEQLILLAPGGIHKPLAFNATIFNSPVRRFFRWTMGSSLMPRIVKASYKMKLIHRSFWDFVKLHFENDRRRLRLFNSWVSLYYFDLNLKKIQGLIREHQTQVEFFYGTKDKITPAHYAHEFAEGLPTAHVTMLEGENHFFINEALCDALAVWLAGRFAY